MRSSHPSGSAPSASAATRRGVLRAGLVAGLTLAATGTAPTPVRLFAAPVSGSSRDRRLFSIARDELERQGAAIVRRDVVAIADFGHPSAVKRFHLLDMEAGRLRSFRVTHGAGSDPDHNGWLDRYSNEHGSNATSRGSYRMRSQYVGKYGESMRMDGLEATNSNALDRAIVMHPADYAGEAHVRQWGRLGRSNGCFAFSDADMREMLARLPDGRLLIADSWGVTDDGSLAHRLPGGLKPLLREPARGRDRMLSAVY